MRDKARWPSRLSVALSLLLVFMIFVPVIHHLGDGNACEYGLGTSNRCVAVFQYDSISMVFGGAGAVFGTFGPTDVNDYHVTVFTCGYGCPLGNTYMQAFLAVFPFALMFWTVLALLVLADFALIIIKRRLTREKAGP